MYETYDDLFDDSKAKPNAELEKMSPKGDYTKSENMDRITEKIYLGDITGANELDYLSKENIHYVISLVGTFSPKYPESQKITQKVIDIDDFHTENIFQYFKECIEFIEKADKVYIHCMCGVSRSTSIVIAYLMWKAHSSFIDTYFFVKNKRRFIGPNEGFCLQLKYFEEVLKKNNYDLNKIDFKSTEYEKLDDR